MNIFKKKAPIIHTFNYKTLRQKYSNPTRMGLPLRHTKQTHRENTTKNTLQETNNNKKSKHL